MPKFLQAMIRRSVAGGALATISLGAGVVPLVVASEDLRPTSSISTAQAADLPLWPSGGQDALQRLPTPDQSSAAPDQRDPQVYLGDPRGASNSESADRQTEVRETASTDPAMTRAEVFKSILGQIASQRNAPAPVDESRLEQIRAGAGQRPPQDAPDPQPPMVAPPREPLESEPLETGTVLPENSALNPVDQPRHLAAMMAPASETRMAPDLTILPIESEEPAPIVEDAGPRLRPAIVQQAQAHINEGIRLARLNAVYSSRAHFIKVVRLVSQALDAESGSKRYSEALAAGLRALDEAAHFRPRGSRLEADLDVAQIVRTHRTPVLRQQDLGQVTPLTAMQTYHAYAEQQLAMAGGSELVAADAYYGLAKLQGHLDSGPVNDIRVGPRAMTYYQTAIIVYPQHFMAANELGVIFARFGQLEDARDVLRFGARAAPGFADLWMNLARVHERLEEDRLAALAIQEYELLRQQDSSRPAATNNRPSVEWMDPATFAQKHPATMMPRKAAPQAATPDANWPFR